MRMYACKRTGKMNTIGSSWYFTDVAGFDSEKCAIKCNKAERAMLLREIGLDLDKEMEDTGSLWIDPNRVKALQGKLKKVEDTNLKPKEITIRDSMIQFMEVCLNVGYHIRVY